MAGNLEKAIEALSLPTRERGPRTVRKVETRYATEAPRKERRERNRARKAAQQRARRLHGRPRGR